MYTWLYVSVALTLLMFLLYWWNNKQNKQLSSSINTLKNDIQTQNSQLSSSINTLKNDIQTQNSQLSSINTAKDSILKLEGDLNTFKPGNNIIPGTSMLSSLLKTVIETKNFASLEQELDKIFTNENDNRLVFLGIQENDVGWNEPRTVAIFVSKKNNKYKY
jgi:hypothetical protein